MIQLIFYFMDGELQKANAWSRIFIGAAIEVHRLKGPGLLEPIYHRCVRRECELRNIPTKYELSVPRDRTQKRYPSAYPLRVERIAPPEARGSVPRRDSGFRAGYLSNQIRHPL